jgi:stage II sporulation protein M
LNESFNEQLKQLILEFEGLGSLETICKIFVNNVIASFLGIFLGVFFGIVTLSFIFVNGYLIGYVMDLSVAAAGWEVLWRLVPHGIFELPAVLLSFALGIKLGMFFLDKDPWEELKRRAKESLNVFILIVVPLLVIAAIIEGILIVAVG